MSLMAGANASAHKLVHFRRETAQDGFDSVALQSILSSKGICDKYLNIKIKDTHRFLPCVPRAEPGASRIPGSECVFDLPDIWCTFGGLGST